MPTRDISCAYCGLLGKIEIWGINDLKKDHIFKYMGHNPWSGHMHFQCPHYKMVSLINPLSVLGDEVICADINPNGSRGGRKKAFFHIYKRMNDISHMSLKSASS